MNTRSLRFQLVIWYAALLTACFVLLGATAYLVLRGYLVGSLKDSELRRAKQIARLLSEQIQRHDTSRIGEEIEARYAPGLNNRFVRVSRAGKDVLFISTPPQDQNFIPSSLPFTESSPGTGTARRVPLPGGRAILVAAYGFQAADNVSYLIEAGAPMDAVQTDLRQWLIILIAGLPIAALIAIGGGSVVVKRALSAADQIASSAERMSSHNLSERLPVAHTGDELERLSLALNRMIERLEQAFQYSRRFMADASHELRTPLTVLKGELESFAQDPHLPEAFRDRVGSALEEVERLVNLVEGLLAISRLDAGEAQAEWVRFDLAQLAASTADQMALLAEDKDIRLNCSAPKEVWVSGDRARLKQVIVNLLDNAIKYTPQAGAVTMAVTAADGRALLEVADNGIGIPDEALPRVFERFFRVDPARSRELGGAGLGLSIVKSICAAHHGRVQATSTPGNGSRFQVELPLAPPSRNGKV